MFSKSGIKYIQSLQHKKFRDEYNSFIAEGPKVVEELLAAKKFNCKNIYATQEWIDSHDKHIMSSFNSLITIVKDFELEKMATYTSPNKVVAEFEKRTLENIPSLRKKITLILDDIRDPGNFGTIIRTADWFGVENIICSPQTVDMYNPKVVQGTMASLGRVNIFYSCLEDVIKNNEQVATYAAVLDGKPLHSIPKLSEGIIIIGNESKGVHKDIADLAANKITISKFGGAESLNAAIAAGIILYALKGK